MYNKVDVLLFSFTYIKLVLYTQHKDFVYMFVGVDIRTLLEYYPL